MKFSIGDKVRVIKNLSGDKKCDKLIGKVGYIGEGGLLPEYPYEIYSRPNKKGRFIRRCKASELSPVKPKKEGKIENIKMPVFELRAREGVFTDSKTYSYELAEKINELVDAFNSTQKGKE